MRRAALPVPLVLLTAGSLSAHELAYRLVAPDADARAHLLAGTGHAYLSHAPGVLALLLALLPVCLAVHAASRDGREPARGLLFLLLPMLGFAVQEHLERWVATGDVPLATAGEPTFLLGMALQVPFAVAALVATRFLLRVAERLARAVRGGGRPTRRVRVGRVRPGVDRLVPRRPWASGGRSERGPPRWAPAPL